MESKPLAGTSEWERRLGEDVRRLRRRRRLTQIELADRANVSLSAVKYLEAGKGSSLATVVRVARALDRTDWLESFIPPEPSVSPIAVLRERQRAEKEDTKRVRRATTDPQTP
jgi:transcriptional regulator with XRE-family HTH domain